MKRIFLTAVLTIIMVSCHNDHSSNVNSPFTEYPSTYQNPYSGIWNSNNPFDSIGYFHNEFLVNYVNNRNDVDFNDFLNTSSTIISNFASSEYNITIHPSEIEDFTTNFFNYLDSLKQQHSTLSGFISAIFPGQIGPIITDIVFLVGTCSSTNEINNKIDSIKLIENVVNNAQHLSSSEKNIIFTVSSTAKFSLSYWGYAAFDNNSEWGSWFDDLYPEEQPQWIHWAAAGAGDAIAAGYAIASGESDPWKIAGKAVMCSAFSYMAADFLIVGTVANAVYAVIGFLISLFGEW